jgi:hypothetical protein
VLLAAAACSSHGQDSFDNYDPADPFNDPFFNSSFESDSLDEFLSEPAPSVGWLSRDGDQSGESQLLRDHSDPIWDDAQGEEGQDEIGPKTEKTFAQKAQEATLATMSILVGAGMAALPYLIGAL